MRNQVRDGMGVGQTFLFQNREIGKKEGVTGPK